VRYAFGEFELDPGSFELRNGGQVVPLQPKVFELICYLLERRDRVVGRRELLEALWPDVHVSESALAWCVSQARKALRQDRAADVPIETLHRRGYRFRSPVRVLESASLPPPPRAPKADALPPEAAGDPFVGRERSMAVLRAALEGALAGHGEGVLLIGDPGIGKTRCAMELAAEAGARGVGVWLGRCPEAAGAPSFWPWIQILRQCEGEEPDSEHGRSAAELLAEIVPQGGEPAERAAAESGEAFWLLDRVVGVLRASAEARPRLLVLDDLQWADALSLRALDLLVEGVAERALLVLATLRDAPELPDASCRAALGRLGRRMKAVALGGLERVAIEQYMTRVTGQGPTPRLVDAVQHRTAGNALFLVETVRQIADRGSPAPDDGSDLEAPRVVRDLVHARLDRLPPGARPALRAASILGESFEVTVVAAMLSVSVHDVAQTLDSAVRDRMLVRTGGIGRYSFVHDLVRDAIQSELAESEKRDLHRLAGETLEARALGEERLTQLAFHFHRALPGATPQKAVDYSARAARAAARTFAHDEARAHWVRALEALDFDPAPDPETRCKLLIGLALVETKLGRQDDCHRHLEQAVRLAKHHGLAGQLVAAGRALQTLFVWPARPVDPLARDALEGALALLPEGEATLRASVLSRLAGMPPYSLSVARSRELSDRALSLARPLGGRSLLEALWSRVFSLSGPDDIDELLRVTGEMLGIDEALGTSWWSGEARYVQFSAHLLRGDVPAAERALEAFGSVAQTLKLPVAVWTYRRLTAQMLFVRGEFREAERRWIELGERAEKSGSPYGRALYPTHKYILERETGEAPATADPRWEIARGWAKRNPRLRALFALHMLEAGRLEEGREAYEDLASAGFASLPRDLSYLATLSTLAVVAVRLGDLPRAEELYERMAPYPLHNTPDSLTFTMGSVSFYLGLLARRLARGPAASAHFELALKRNQEMGLRPWVARTELGLAELLSAKDRDSQRAVELVDAAVTLAEELGMLGVAADARTLRVALGGGSGSQPGSR
jgi:DNA-binding winged helix-turn-helix (wHTH) protein/tetratricopeptide (TPR) repeat protein